MSMHALLFRFRGLVSVLALLLAGTALAGGGPETTLLVVNARSAHSLQVANEYIALRELPPKQVVWLDNVPDGHTLDIDRFRDDILAPVRAHMQEHGLDGEIDLVVYSAGFPYAVNFRRDERAHGMKPNEHRGDAGSLTGMTFFARQVEAGRVDYFGGNANPYFRRPVVGRSAQGSAQRLVRFEVTRGFRSQYNWARNPAADSVTAEGFFLSAMLGYTGYRGNSVPEVLAYLRRAAGSDATHPEGTVYVMENGDIRTRTRRPMFAPMQLSMQARGRKVELLKQNVDGENGRVPQNRDDVIGVVAGTRTFDWEASGSRMLPGAIAESFTSYAGHFEHPAQTKLSAFLRHGAAGSSGAVREPYNFLQKFPLPQLHAYYADGASLAEAYYQSVSSPYQLLLVGEPLARPFARFARISLASPGPGLPWRGRVEVHAGLTPAPGRPVREVELWVNGRPMTTAAPGQALMLDTEQLPDGYNEVRLVAVADTAIESRASVREWIEVDNRPLAVSVRDAPERAALDERVELAGEASGAEQVRLVQGTRVLARADVDDGQWRLAVPAEQLGMGPVALQVEARDSSGLRARSAPMQLQVTEPDLIPARPDAPATQAGLTLRVPRANAQAETVHVEGLAGRMPRDIRGGLNEVEAEGYVHAREAGLYEVTVQASASFELEIGDAWHDGKGFREHTGDVRFFVPLQAGWHPFRLALWNMGSDELHVFFGGPEPAFRLAGERVRALP